MPIVTVELWEGRGPELKKKLAEDITNAVVDNLKCPPQAVTVLFRDSPMHNWAMGGKLASELFKDRAAK